MARLSVVLPALPALPALRSAVLLPLLALGLLAAGGAARADDVPALVGRTAVLLPAPQGYAEPASKAPPLRVLGETLTPPSNRLLAIFVSDDDLQRASTGERPTLNRYFMVQTLRAAEDTSLSRTEFGEVRELLRKQYRQMLQQAAPGMQQHLDSVNRRLSQDGDEGAKVRVGEITPVEVFDDRDTSLSLLALTKVSVQDGGQNKEYPLAMGLTTGTVKNKLVYFYVYSRYEGVADLEWIKAQTRAWLPRLAAAN